MTEQAYRTVLKLLPTLSAQELAGVVMGIKALGGTGGVSITLSDNGDEDALILRCLCEHLSTKGIDFAQPAVLMRMAVYPSFKRKCPDIIQYLAHSQIMTRTEQSAVLAIAFGLLYSNLTEMGLAVDASTMLRHVHRIPALLNREYPGYAQAGYLKKLVRS